MTPRFSILIPTRNRESTLRHAIRTCLVQEHESFEVVVCDNCSSQQTVQAVKGFKDKRIRYIRSDRPLPMTENWELAVSHARGEYLIVIGDDDGLMLHALRDIDRLLRELNPRVLRWERVVYCWPDVPGLADRMRVPLFRDDMLLNSRKVMLNAANGNRRDFLPMLYNSAVHRDLIAELQRRTGRVLSSMSPDIYSGFAIAYLAEEFHSAGRPMTVSGLSGRSNGMAFASSDEESAGLTEFLELNRESDFRIHPAVPAVLGVIPVAVADSFLRAKEQLFPGDRRLTLNRKRLLNRVIQGIERQTEDMRRRSVLATRAAISDDPRLSAWFETRIANVASIPEDPAERERPLGIHGRNLDLDSAVFGVSNVFDAAVLCEKILGFKAKQVEWRARPSSEILGRIRNAGRMLIHGR